MKAIIIIIPVLVTAVIIQGSDAREYKIDLWEHAGFSGEGLLITHYGLEFCDSLGETDKWRNRFTSINTHDNCFVIFDKIGCTGDKRYLYPSSPAHNNLAALEFNDVVNSFQLCDLDESLVEPGEVDFKNSDFSRGPFETKRKEEFVFWRVVFDAFSSEYSSAFLERSEDSNFIAWDFIKGVEGTLGRQYQQALEWLDDQLSKNFFNLTQMQRMRKFAGKVLEVRHERNSDYEKSDVGTQAHAIHTQLELMWRNLVAKLDLKMEEARTKAFGGYRTNRN